MKLKTKNGMTTESCLCVSGWGACLDESNCFVAIVTNHNQMTVKQTTRAEQVGKYYEVGTNRLAE